MEIERQLQCLRIRVLHEDASQTAASDPQCFARRADAPVDDGRVGKEIGAVIQDEFQRWIGSRNHKIEPAILVLLGDVATE